MFSESKPFSLTGLPNSQIFFSEKDPNPKEFNFLVRPTLELGDDGETVPQELHQEKEVEEEGKQEDKCEISVPTLKIKFPSLGAFQIEDSDHGDGSKTPTSSDCKIPVIFNVRLHLENLNHFHQPNENRLDGESYLICPTRLKLCFPQLLLQILVARLRKLGKATTPNKGAS